MQIERWCSSSSSWRLKTEDYVRTFGGVPIPRSRCGAPGWMQDDIDRLEAKLVVFKIHPNTFSVTGECEAEAGRSSVRQVRHPRFASKFGDLRPNSKDAIS